MGKVMHSPGKPTPAQLVAAAAQAEADRLAAEAAAHDSRPSENMSNSDNSFKLITFVVSLILLVVAILYYGHDSHRCDRSWKFSPPGLRNLRKQGILGFGTSMCGCGYELHKEWLASFP